MKAIERRHRARAADEIRRADYMDESAARFLARAAAEESRAVNIDGDAAWRRQLLMAAAQSRRFASARQDDAIDAHARAAAATHAAEEAGR